MRSPGRRRPSAAGTRRSRLVRGPAAVPTADRRREGLHRRPRPRAAVARDLADAANRTTRPVGPTPRPLIPAPQTTDDAPRPIAPGPQRGMRVVEDDDLVGQAALDGGRLEQPDVRRAGRRRPGQDSPSRAAGRRSGSRPASARAARRARRGRPARPPARPPGARPSDRGRPRGPSRRRHQRDVGLRVAAVDGEDRRDGVGRGVAVIGRAASRRGRRRGPAARSRPRRRRRRLDASSGCAAGGIERPDRRRVAGQPDGDPVIRIRPVVGQRHEPAGRAAAGRRSSRPGGRPGRPRGSPASSARPAYRPQLRSSGPWRAGRRRQEQLDRRGAGRRPGPSRAGPRPGPGSPSASTATTRASSTRQASPAGGERAVAGRQPKLVTGRERAPRRGRSGGRPAGRPGPDRRGGSPPARPSRGAPQSADSDSHRRAAAGEVVGGARARSSSGRGGATTTSRSAAPGRSAAARPASDRRADSRGKRDRQPGPGGQHEAR